MGDFSHLQATGRAEMVDISHKVPTDRNALVAAEVHVSAACTDLLDHDKVAEIASVARTAGVLAAKDTSHLIPLCHQVPLKKVEISIEFDKEMACFRLTARTKATGETGVEMEAFVGASIASLTIYDMIKAVDPQARIEGIKLLEKSGGKKGMWQRNS